MQFGPNRWPSLVPSGKAPTPTATAFSWPISTYDSYVKAYQNSLQWILMKQLNIPYLYDDPYIKMISSLTRFFWAAWIYKVHVVAPVLKWALWAVGCDVTSHVTFSKKIKSVLRIRFHVYQISMTPTTILWTRQRRQGTTSLLRPPGPGGIPSLRGLLQPLSSAV